jgi:F-type H+-transporting ATPase subunit gamma
MSEERLSDVRARIAATRQLEMVFTAMRGLAAARSREAQNSLAGVRAYSHALGEAIGAALALGPEDAAVRRTHDGNIVLAFCAEQGFAGAFSDRVLAAAARSAPGAALFIVGERGAASAREQGVAVDWSASMPAHVEDAPLLAERIAEALYERLSVNAATRVTLAHSAQGAAGGIEVLVRPLIPLDLSRFPAPQRLRPPLVNLAPAALVANLAQEYIFAELCEATVLSFAAENEARMQAMSSARSNVRKTLDELTMRHRRLRQEQITEEIIELARR